jgi:hypothetical protein
MFLKDFVQVALNYAVVLCCTGALSYTQQHLNNSNALYSHASCSESAVVTLPQCLCGPIYVPVYPSVTGPCLCVLPLYYRDCYYTVPICVYKKHIL